MTSAKKNILFRVYFVFLFLCLFGAAVVFRIWKLQVQEGAYWDAQADSLTTAVREIDAARGNIYARDNILLATSVPIYEIHVDFKAEGFSGGSYRDNAPRLARGLADLFPDKTAAQWRRTLDRGRQQQKRYFLLRRNVSYTQLKTLRTLPIFNRGQFRGGIIVEQHSKRQLPFRKLAARTIGHSRRNAPNVGIEGMYNEHLRGVRGVRLMQRISGGVWKPLNSDNEIEPQDGYDVITTLDISIQDVAEHSLEKRLSEHNAEQGCAILMEVATGEIRAIANLKLGEDGVYREVYNYAVGASTEPGSTFKLHSLMAAIEDGHVLPDDSVDTGKGRHYWTGRYAMDDSKRGGYGRISVRRAFAVSSNIGISKVIHRSYQGNPQAFVDRLRTMHVGEKLGLKIKGEGSPLIKDTDNKSWSRTTLPYMSIGYESRFTPLQILAFYNAVANNGVLVRPRFVSAIQENGRMIEQFNPVVIDSAICSPATITAAREMLEQVVQEGTGTKLRHSQYRIAGKTGTARVAQNNKGYIDPKYQASFVGYFPADRPRYSCMVVVYAPSNDVYYASEVAAPIFKDIADKVYATRFDLQNHDHDTLAPLLAHPPAKPGPVHYTRLAYAGLSMGPAFLDGLEGWVKVSGRSGKLKGKKIEQPEGRVPDVRGMGLRDAVYLLENAGLQVSVTGRGRVVTQSPEPGAEFQRGQAAAIALN